MEDIYWASSQSIKEAGNLLSPASFLFLEGRIYLLLTTPSTHIDIFHVVKNLEIWQTVNNQSTLTLQMSRVPQIQGIKATAVVIYRKAFITKEMRYHRLSWKVNNAAKNLFSLDYTNGSIL